MMKYEIWMEGFAATGESQGAQLLGSAEGDTFLDACKSFVNTNPDYKPYFKHRFTKRDMMPGYEHMAATYPPTIWGCRLFDNEIDARKDFG